MSLPAFQATVVNELGELLPAATITVLVEATGSPGVLFSDRNGTVPLGTLGVFSVDAEAFAQFFASPGNYRITANDSGSGFSRTWDYVVLSGTAATKDINASGDVWGASNVEYGSNSNGEYWKYPDGKLICTRSATGNGFTAFSLPSTFVGDYRLIGNTVTSTTDTIINIKFASKTATSFECGAPGITQAGVGIGFSSAAVLIDVLAIGRWK